MASQITMLRIAAVLLLAATMTPAVRAQGFRAEGRVRRGPADLVDALTAVITSTVHPSTWDSVGGEGSITIIEPWGVAVVSQTRTAHERIEALLATVRSVREQQDESAAPKTESAAIEEFESGRQNVKHIEKVLRSTTKMDFLDEPLAEAIRQLEQQHDIQIKIDRRALEESGVSPEAPVQLAVSDVTLRSALNLLLHDVGLTYVIANEVLMITTPDEAETRLTTRVYPVRDLISRVYPVEDSFLE